VLRKLLNTSVVVSMSALPPLQAIARAYFLRCSEFMFLNESVGCSANAALAAATLRSSGGPDEPLDEAALDDP
jgi:hypothetical protein